MATSSSNSTSSVSSDNALKNADASDTPHNILIAQQQFIELTKAEATKNAKNSIPTPVFNEKITPNTKRFSSPFQYTVPISQAVQV